MNNNRFKFRRPNFQNGKFIGFDYYELNQGLVINEEHCEMTDSYKENPTMGAHGHIVGQDEQCIGLKDEIGDLMYQNDIVFLDKDTNNTYQVVWDDRNVRFEFQPYNQPDLTLAKITKSPGFHYARIIGNIHEVKE